MSDNKESALPPIDCGVATTSAAPLTKLGMCEVCAGNAAKYTCPRCEVKTCSLKCSRIHKLEVECNGERDRTKFVSIKKFTNLDLSSDYRLLEEITRVVEVSRKGMVNQRYGLTRRFLKLQEQALKRNIPLKFLPKTFVRHKTNTTWFNIGLKQIEWRIDWIFVNSNNLKLTEAKVPENTKVGTALNKYLVKQGNPELQEKLQYYQAADLPGIKVLLKAEQKPGRKFYELDPTLTFKECLRHKVIIEYPTIVVALKDHATSYEIVDSDDEEDEKRELHKQCKSGREVINKIVKKSESDEGLYESLRNLLFLTEYSDEEGNSDE